MKTKGFRKLRVTSSPAITVNIWGTFSLLFSKPANNEKLPLGGVRSDAGPDVHSEQSAAAVEDGGQRGHEGSQHDSQHQTSQTCSGETPRMKEGRKEDGRG